MRNFRQKKIDPERTAAKISVLNFQGKKHMNFQ